MNKLKKHLTVIMALVLVFLVVGNSALAILGNVETADAATKIHLKKTSAYIAVKDTYKLTLVDAKGKTISASKVTWSTSKKSVAVVNKKGVITAQKAGTAKIYAKYNGKKYTFTAKVKNPYVNLKKEALIPGVSIQGKLSLTSLKSLDKDKVDWEIADEAVATVDGDGVITAVGIGETTLTAIYNGKSFNKQIYVVEPRLERASITVEEGRGILFGLYAESPSGVKCDWSTSENVSWITANTGIAKIQVEDDALIVEGIAEGKTTATATINGKSYTFEIKVIPVISLNYTNKNLDKGETLQLKTNYTGKINWTSGNTKVATVSTTGLVKAVGYGTTNIMAEVDGLVCSCKITITEPTLYTTTDTVSISKNGSYSLPVTFTKSGTVSYDISDSSVVSCIWSKSWSDNTTHLKISAKEPGTTYVTVSNSYDDTKVKVKVTVESPLKIVLPSLPQTLHEYDYKGRVESTFKITNITYEVKYYSYDDDYTVYLYFDGEKSYDENGPGQSSSCKIGWKLYNANGSVVESGTCYSSNLAMGERFEGEKDIVFDLKEGTYTLKILNTN